MTGKRSGNTRSIIMILSVILLASLFVLQAEAASGRLQVTGPRYVAVGKKIKLTASENVTWKSSRPSVAKVSKDGKVKGLRPGMVYITATTKRKPRVVKRFRITVKKNAVQRIRLSAKKLTLDVTYNPSATLAAKASPASAAQAFSWSSSNSGIAKVSSRGVVKALKAGKVRITCASVDGSKKKVTITVTVTDKKKEELERKKKEEEERLKREEEERKKKEEEERLKKEEEERLKREEEERLKKEEEERIRKEEEFRRQRAEARDADPYWNILLIGGSYTQDEFGYVPALLKEFFPTLKFRIGLLFSGGASIKTHYTIAQKEGSYSLYSEYTSESTKWENVSNYSLEDALQKYCWKIVTLQQNSASQGDEASMELIDELMEGYSKTLGWEPVYLYVFPHVRGAGNSLISPGTTEDAFGKYVPIAQKVMGTYPFTALISTAAAVENARKTSLNTAENAGGNGGDMTKDTTHLQDGLPCLVANYCAFLGLLPHIGNLQADLRQSKILPTQEWIIEQNVPGRHGPSIGATEENRLLAAECALLAAQSPYTISVFETAPIEPETQTGNDDADGSTETGDTGETEGDTGKGDDTTGTGDTGESTGNGNTGASTGTGDKDTSAGTGDKDTSTGTGDTSGTGESTGNSNTDTSTGTGTSTGAGGQDDSTGKAV